MERVDRAKKDWVYPNWNTPSYQVDASTVELRGSRLEADLIVNGLRMLVLEKQKLEILTGESQGSRDVQRLIDDISRPQYETPGDAASVIPPEPVDPNLIR